MKYVYIALMVVMIVGNAGGYWMRSHRHWIFRDCSTLPLKPNTLDCQDSSDSFLTNHDRFKHITKEISTKIDHMKEILKHKRYELSHLREKKFEGGKSECLKVQYEVREFLVSCTFLRFSNISQLILLFSSRQGRLMSNNKGSPPRGKS